MIALQLHIYLRLALTIAMAMFIGGLLLTGSTEALGHSLQLIWQRVTGGLQ